MSFGDADNWSIIADPPCGSANTCTWNFPHERQCDTRMCKRLLCCKKSNAEEPQNLLERSTPLASSFEPRSDVDLSVDVDLSEPSAARAYDYFLGGACGSNRPRTARLT